MGDDARMASPLSRKRPPAPDPDAPVQKRKKRTTQDMIEENKGPGVVVGALRTLAGLAIALAIGAVIFFGASAIEGDDPSPRAPWTSSSAPEVTPEPLVDQ